MYDPLAVYYEEIFPVSSSQLEFVYSATVPEGRAPVAPATGSPRRLLDVGCAVGDLASALNEKGLEVDGIDLNPAMIRRARERHRGKTEAGGLRFFEMNMGEIGQTFEAQSFDTVTCLGNTLVHLPGAREIEGFLRSATFLLKGCPTASATSAPTAAQVSGPAPASAPTAASASGGRGRLILQILNYDFLLARRPEILPPIETEHVLFERGYLYPDAPGDRITFATRLRIKKSGKAFDDSVELYPLRKNELESVLKRAGCPSLRFYGGFDGSSLKPDSFPLIVVAESV